MPKFVPRQRKHRVIARQKAARKNALKTNQSAEDVPTNNDSNTLEIHSTSKGQHEEKKEKLREELRSMQPKTLIQS